MPHAGRWIQALRLRALAIGALGLLASCAEQPTEESNGIVVDDQGHTRTDPSPVAPFGEMRLRPIRPSDLVRVGPMLAADSSGTGKAHFLRLVRASMETQNFVTMDSSIAYTRDLCTGADWSVQNAQDGDSWNVTFTMANGGVVSSPDLRFVATLGSETNCFISGLSHLCGFTGVFVESYFTSQCGATGAVQVTFTENAATWGTDTFRLKDQIPDAAVPRWNQNAYSSTAYDNQCIQGADKDHFVTCGRDASAALLPGFTTASVAKLGCAITTAVNAMTYNGIATDPVALNTWLSDTSGYDDGTIVWTKVPEYALSLGSNFLLRSATSVPANPIEADFNRLRGILNTSICRYGPASVQVRYTGSAPKLLPKKHWVSPYGRTPDTTSYLISNPVGIGTGEHTGQLQTLSEHYPNRIYRVVIWQKAAVPNLAAIEVHGHSPIEYVLTDPMGRRLGVDPATGQQYTEIPDADYSVDNLTSDEDGDDGATHPIVEAIVPVPVAGTYELQVTGTDTGTYSLSVFTTLTNGGGGTALVPETPTWTGAVHRYTFEYSPSGGTPPSLDRGAFTGGGQSTDADQLITYSVPGMKSTAVPAGVTSVPIVLYLDPAVDPASVSLLWNGVEVRPAIVTPGTAVRLTLPLAPGRNVFLASANGMIGGHNKADKDRLVFTQ